MAKTIEQLKAQGAEVKNANVVGENTATRVGTLFTDIVEHVEAYEQAQAERDTKQDAAAENLVNAEAEARSLAVSQEAQARTQADEQLNKAIVAEKERAEAAEQANAQAIAEEKAAIMGTDRLAPLAVTTEKIANGAVTIEKIADNAIDDEPIAGSGNLIKSSGITGKSNSYTDNEFLNKIIKALFIADEDNSDYTLIFSYTPENNALSFVITKDSSAVCQVYNYTNYVSGSVLEIPKRGNNNVYAYLILDTDSIISDVLINNAKIKERSFVRNIYLDGSFSQKYTSIIKEVVLLGETDGEFIIKYLDINTLSGKVSVQISKRSNSYDKTSTIVCLCNNVSLSEVIELKEYGGSGISGFVVIDMHKTVNLDFTASSIRVPALDIKKSLEESNIWNIIYRQYEGLVESLYLQGYTENKVIKIHSIYIDNDNKATIIISEADDRYSQSKVIAYNITPVDYLNGETVVTLSQVNESGIYGIMKINPLKMSSIDSSWSESIKPIIQCVYTPDALTFITNKETSRFNLANPKEFTPNTFVSSNGDIENTPYDLGTTGLIPIYIGQKMTISGENYNAYQCNAGFYDYYGNKLAIAAKGVSGDDHITVENNVCASYVRFTFRNNDRICVYDGEYVKGFFTYINFFDKKEFSIELPPTLFLAKDKEYNIYTNMIHNAPVNKCMHMVPEGNYAEYWMDRFTKIKPSVAGITNLNLSLKDDLGNIHDNKDINLSIIDASAKTSISKNILVIGHSMVDMAFYKSCRSQAEVDGVNLNFIGSKTEYYEKANNANVFGGIRGEGWSGATIDNFTTKQGTAYLIQVTGVQVRPTNCYRYYGSAPYKDVNNVVWRVFAQQIGDDGNGIMVLSSPSETGAVLPDSGIITLNETVHFDSDATINFTKVEEINENPFWDISKNTIDFSSYLKRWNLSPDIVVIALTVNGMNNYWSGAKVKEHCNKYVTLVNSIKNTEPNIKIILCMMHWKADDSIVMVKQHRDEIKYDTMNTFEYLSKIYSEDNSVLVYPLGAFFDDKNGFNMDNNITPYPQLSNIKASLTWDGTHCSEAGYQMMSDALYPCLLNYI